MKGGKSMKKIMRAAALICALTMGVGAFSGCGKQQSSNNVKTLTWYLMGDTSMQDNEEVFAKASDMVYNELGFKVNFKPIDMSSYGEKMKMIIAGGEDYDICWTSNWINDYATNVTNGAYMELDELLEKTPKLKETIDEKLWEGVKINGKIYGVPVQQIAARNACLRIPEEFYEKYGDTLKDVKSYEDLGPYLEAVSKDYPNTAHTTLYWQNLCYAYGVDQLLETGMPVAVSFDGDPNDIKVYNPYDTDEWRNLIKVRKSWTDKGYTVQVTDGDTTGDQRLAKEVPVAVDCYKPGFEQAVFPNTGYNVKPILISDSYLSSAGICATIYSVNVRSKNADEAIKLLEYANTTPDFVNLFTYGIEGKHYVKVDENTVKRVEDAGYKSDSWMIANVYNSYLLEGQDPDTWEQTKKLNNEAKASKLLGFNADTKPIKLQIANCKSAMTDYTTRINNGIGDVEALNEEMLQQLKIAGIDDIISELQRQIDEWLKTK